MKLTVVLFAATLFFSSQGLAAENQSAPYAGSKSCRECHERFYGLWSGSMHGLAMQPYTRVCQGKTHCRGDHVDRQDKLPCREDR